MKGEDAMETEPRLDDRKIKILKAIIQNYLDTGEPVGSRTISKLTDLQLSSATIRNEMADLEELGYIVQLAYFLRIDIQGRPRLDGTNRSCNAQTQGKTRCEQQTCV